MKISSKNDIIKGREGDTEFFKDIKRWEIKSLANKLREEIGIKREIRKRWGKFTCWISEKGDLNGSIFFS